jgi:uncharacterized protein YhbP (UPF0306 family)
MSPEQPTADLPPNVVEYLGRMATLTLATASPSGVPRASTFLYVYDGAALYFWTRPGTTTVQQIDQNPLVSFTIDEYSADLRQTRGVQGQGECRTLLDGERIAMVADLFGQKFPDLSPGNTLSISFFCITPSELQFIDNTGVNTLAVAGTFGAEFHRERAYSVFGDLPARSVDLMSGSLQTLNVNAGDVIFREGGPADKFIIVVEGEVEIARASGASEPLKLTAGDFFGEVAILRDTPRTATARATKPTRLLAMEHDTFRDLVAQSLGTTTEFDQVIRARLRAGAAG